MLMKLSIIIPCFNAESTIAAQLEALAKQQWSEPWEVIVSDNGSTDRSVVIIKQYQKKLPNLQIVDSSDLRGSAHARNVGARVATGTAIAFCDADDEVGSDWIAVMGKALSEYDFVAGCCELRKLNSPWVIKVRLGGELRDSWQDGVLSNNSLIKYPIAGACNIGIKRSVHEAVGGFDESPSLIYGGEDVDYCWRVQLAGIKLHHIPNLVIHYRLRHTLTSIYRQAYGYGKASVFIHKKYLSSGIYLHSVKNSAPDWRLLLTDILKIRSIEDLALCLWKLGYNLGCKQATRNCNI